MITNELLIYWYDKNKRNLPWRKTTNPYHIWLSEIMLQQTRVEQGLPYYLKFLDQYPTIELLANADEAEVLTLWQGLGYYSRARNLHFTAKYISNTLNGVFPNTYASILGLRGVGPYTAAAISSFAFNIPKPVIDGNVQRVISRLFSINKPIDRKEGKTELEEALNSIFSINQTANFNQAIMELGSIIFTPKLSKCNECPLQSKCTAYANNTVYNYPIKSSKTNTKKVTHHYFHIKHKGKTYIEKRLAGIWINLHQFPLIEGDLTLEELLNTLSNIVTFEDKIELNLQYSAKHLLSHRKITANFYTIHSSKMPIFSKRDIFEIDLGELSVKYPTSVLNLNYLKQLNK